MAQQFRKKPVVIEAVLWQGYNPEEILAFCPAALFDSDLHVVRIPTLEGTMAATPGDWIVKGVKGEFYPVHPEIFAATYDEVE